jgi:hypothetical protein
VALRPTTNEPDGEARAARERAAVSALLQELAAHKELLAAERTRAETQLDERAAALEAATKEVHA